MCSVGELSSMFANQAAGVVLVPVHIQSGAGCVDGDERAEASMLGATGR